MIRDERWLLVPIFFCLALVVVSDVIPIIVTARLSVERVHGRTGGAWGIVVRDPLFLRALRNTVLFALGTSTLQVALGMLLAHAIVALPPRARVAWFALLLAPWLASEVASVVLWRGILQHSVGHLDRWMRALGLGPLGLLASSSTALPALVVVATWQGVGFTTMVLFGALASIPRSLSHAASVCGLTPWATFLRVQLPLLAPTATALWVAVALHCANQFALPARLTMGGPGHATAMASLYLYDRLVGDPTPAVAAAGGCLILAALGALVLLVWGLRQAVRSAA